MILFVSSGHCLIPPSINDPSCEITAGLGKDRRQEVSRIPQQGGNLSGRLDSIWKDCFRNSRNIKTNPKTPDFHHKGSKESLWIHSWFNPCGVQEELKYRSVVLVDDERKTGGIQALGDGVLCTERKAKGLQYKAQQEVEEEKLLYAGKGKISRKLQQQEAEEQEEAVALVTLLNSCAKQKDLQKGTTIHDDISTRALLRTNVFVGSALVNMYAKCGALRKAQEVLNELSVRNSVTWNSLIAGYAQHGYGKEALRCFEEMQLCMFSPNAVTFACVLKACGSLGELNKGQQIHAQIIKDGRLEKGIHVGTALVDMYGKCGSVTKAQEAFDRLPFQSIISWTALITGYAQHGHGHDALECFKQMQGEGVLPNAITYTCVLKACASLGSSRRGQEIHAQIIKDGLPRNDIHVVTALLDMYAKCGELEIANEIFEELPFRNIVTWSSLIAGYAQEDRGEEALERFEEMQLEGLSPNEITFVSILNACGSIGASEKGRQVHAQIVKEGLLGDNVIVANALVDMYVKCMLLAEAQYVQDTIPFRNVVSLNALMAGYGQIGKVEIVLMMLEKWREEGNEPSTITLSIVLTTFSHGGIVDKGQRYFEDISEKHGILRTLDHFTCMVDLLSRAGLLDESVAVIKELPFSGDVLLWLTMLGASGKWGNTKLGRWAFEQAAHKNGKGAAPYVSMSNVYAAWDRQEAAEKLEAMLYA